MNINKYQQRGMSAIMLIFSIVILIFAVSIVIKLVPIYMNDLIVAKGLEKVKKTPDVELKSHREIQRILSNYLSQQNFEGFNNQNFNEYVDIEEISEGIEMTVIYHRIVPLISNISLLVDFEHSLEVP